MPECPNCKRSYEPTDCYCEQCGTRLKRPEIADNGAITRRVLSLIDVHHNIEIEKRSNPVTNE